MDEDDLDRQQPLRRVRRRPPLSAAAAEASPTALLRALFGLVLVALLLLAISTFLLWRVADHTAHATSAASTQQVPPLPPASSASGGRALLSEFDSTNRYMRELLDAFRQANLGALQQDMTILIANTSGLPRTNALLSRLAADTTGLSGLAPELAELRSSMSSLTASVPTLTDAIGTTNGSLARVAGMLRRTSRVLSSADGAIKVLGGGLSRANGALLALAGGVVPLNGTLLELKAALDAATQSIDHTNQCLERPVVCQAERRG